MRGEKGSDPAQNYRPGWITPACAGKRLCLRELAVLREDHPRVCGEKTDTVRDAVARVGSPPRVRGKVVLPDAQTISIRDHPRVCGEKPQV